MKNRVGFLLLIFMFSVASGIAQTKIEGPTTLVKIGDQVPSFSYEYKSGKKAKISDLKGKFVLINFFATWCGPCRKELPKIQSEIWAKHKDNIKFAMLTFGREHTWAEVDKFRIDQKFEFPMYPDPTRAVYGLFAKQTIPRSFLLDESGKIIFMSEDFEEGHFSELVKLINSKL